MQRAILTDIEGTTSPIAFVREVLFPYARQALPDFVREHGHDPQVRHWLDSATRETGSPDDQALIQTLQDWIDADRKHTALKALQGMIWQHGYQAGRYQAPIYPDVPPALRAWQAAGHRLYVYSSGSVPAQKLYFGHSEAGDLRALFSGWFDTETGPKRETESYRAIAHAIGREASEILFLSDVVAELDAARQAGFATVLLDRREDYPEARTDAACSGHHRVESFAEINPDA